MNNKPFIERIVPGITFQVQKSATFLLDLNPILAWRLTGRWTVGGGWNERISFSDWNQVVEQDRIYGPRAFTTFELGKGFFLKTECEKMNVFIPTFFGTMDGTREWVWGVFTGLKKDCRLLQHVSGNVQVLYNIYDDHGNSPYLERLNVRMGFDIGLQK